MRKIVMSHHVLRSQRAYARSAVNTLESEINKTASIWDTYFQVPYIEIRMLKRWRSRKLHICVWDLSFKPSLRCVKYSHLVPHEQKCWAFDDQWFSLTLGFVISHKIQIVFIRETYLCIKNIHVAPVHLRCHITRISWSMVSTNSSAMRASCVSI